MDRHTDNLPSNHGFAPGNLTDGRKPGDWKTRYPEKEAQRAIRFEAIYVVTLFFCCPVLLFLVWKGSPNPLLGLNQEQYSVLSRYLYSWIGGLLGGTLFDLKWLYHSVAHQLWNRDRRLWRLLAPHLSAALSFIFVVMIDSGIIVIFDPSSLSKPPAVISIAFLVGYFSDSALAKLSDVAYSLFGSSRRN